MVQAVERALALLDEVGRRGDWVGVRELARAVDLKVPTAQNLLKTLAAHGYLEFDPGSRRYRVGLAVAQLGASVDPVRRSAEFARPYLQALFRDLGETVAAAILHRGRLVLADWIQAKQPLAVYFDAVAEHPHLLAVGKVLLAAEDEAFQRHYAAHEPLSELGPNTPGSVAELLEELHATRAQGYGEVINPGGNGVAAVAVPVLGPTGRAVLGLGCSIPMARYDTHRLLEMRQHLQATAAAMGDALAGGKRHSPGEEEVLPCL